MLSLYLVTSQCIQISLILNRQKYCPSCHLLFCGVCYDFHSNVCLQYHFDFSIVLISRLYIFQFIRVPQTAWRRVGTIQVSEYCKSSSNVCVNFTMIYSEKQCCTAVKYYKTRLRFYRWIVSELLLCPLQPLRVEYELNSLDHSKDKMFLHLCLSAMEMLI